MWGVCLMALISATAQAQEVTRSTELQLPGVSHHFGSPRMPGKSWTQRHDGLGLQLSEYRDGRVRRFTAGFMRDSFGKQGLYAGAAFGWRVLENSFNVDVGAAPMLLYRTIKFDTRDRKLIPIVLPMISFEHRHSGIGGNLTVLPGGNFGKELRFPGLIYLQFTYRLQ